VELGRLLTLTDATAELLKSDAVMKAFRDRLPIRRAGTPINA
jgi:hypothetical protein